MEYCFRPQANLAGKVYNIKTREGSFLFGVKYSCHFICLTLQCEIRYPQKESLHGNTFWA